MKQGMKTFCLFLVAALCCYNQVIGSVSESLNTSSLDYNFEHESAADEPSFQTVEFSQSGTNAKSSNHSESSNFDKLSFLWTHFPWDSIYFSKFDYHQYTCFWNNLIINSRKSDIIFPFHYFW